MSCERWRRCTPSAAITIPKGGPRAFPSGARCGSAVCASTSCTTEQSSPSGRHRGGSRVIITGHSHKPCIETWDGALFVNPGSAGPRRFNLPVAAGEIEIRGERLHVRLIDLSTRRALPGLSARLVISAGREMRHV